MTAFVYSVIEGSKLQFDTWDAIRHVVYANIKLSAIVDFKKLMYGLISFSYSTGCDSYFSYSIDKALYIGSLGVQNTTL